ncbi:MAG: hypothetical protein KKF77_09380 [Proteobacteria bacterium]|nr:hypothetical protein [Pseudomonadota bacterium]
MTAARFTLTRGKYGSPLIYDNVERRPAAVFLRDYGDADVVPEAADAAAMQKARICAQALNRVDEEIKWKKQQKEGGR